MANGFLKRSTTPERSAACTGASIPAVQVAHQGIERGEILVRCENALQLGKECLGTVVGEKAGGHFPFRLGIDAGDERLATI